MGGGKLRGGAINRAAETPGTVDIGIFCTDGDRNILYSVYQ